MWYDQQAAQLLLNLLAPVLMTTMSKKTCFVIAPIGEVNSETRKRSDRFIEAYYNAYGPSVRLCGGRESRPDRCARNNHEPDHRAYLGRHPRYC
jgi:hypothetical protein